MDDIINLINQVGFPVASALGLGFFIWKLINRIIDGMEQKIDVVDEKVDASLNAMEQRISSKLDTHYGITVSLIDRCRQIDQSLIRNDIMLKTLLKVPELIDTYDITKAEKEDQRRD